MAASNSALVIPPPSADAALLTNDIRPIRPPVEVPGGWAWVAWTLGALALAALAWWLWRWWRKKQQAASAEPVIPPHVRARQRLEAALLQIADPPVFVTLVSAALRIYLEERFQLRAPERTTEEFLNDLQSTHRLTEGQKVILADFLQRCDLVKFAKFEPPETALRELYEVASRLVDETRYEPLAGAGADSQPGPEAPPAGPETGAAAPAQPPS